MTEPVITAPRRTFGATFLTVLAMNRWSPLFPLGMALGLVAVTAVFPPSTPGPEAFWFLVTKEWGVFVALMLALYAWQASHTVKYQRLHGPDTFRIDTQGVACTGSHEDVQRPWDEIRRVCLTRKDILLYFSYGSAHALPRAQLSTDEEARILTLAASAGVRIRGSRRRTLPDPIASHAGQDTGR